MWSARLEGGPRAWQRPWPRFASLRDFGTFMVHDSDTSHRAGCFLQWLELPPELPPGTATLFLRRVRLLMAAAYGMRSLLGCPRR